ncbi:hypothetical protein NEOLEDRAFT_1064634 [Neolentinus lepideus HHB14362 ss-1]|uniref:Uncharacterized protein n=1 Tax=Neolentinus lepideus HHB14362 ss-1 TaxID=1314782 RepID=A0A165SWE0_9AGAM|nr:hypothetical protein NEOLEDRAFT_1064634 [Neolentinus lepideus HHB14362 ss-1]
MWGSADSGSSQAIADTFFHAPLLDVPEKELQNDAVTQMLTTHAHLFKIITPIKVAVFENLVHNHPNQPFVHLVCKGLQEGFWSYANAFPDHYPDIFDNSVGGPKDEQQAEFMREQHDDKVKQEWYSPSFGKHLLPGMYNIPIHTVPKPPLNSGCLRLVINMSAGDYAPNSVIMKQAIAGLHLNGMHALGEALLWF